MTHQTFTLAGSASIEDIRQEVIRGLQNAHAMEQQSITMMEGNVERLENYPELRDRSFRHLDESRRQQELISEALELLGSSRSRLTDTVTGLVAGGQLMAHTMTPDEVLKNSFGGYAFEHFEIAAYRTLIQMAEAASEHRIVQIVHQILPQEEDMARWMIDNMPQIVDRYLTLLPSGEQKR